MAEKKNMDPIMVDLETLGTSPNSAILSLGAVKFDPETEKFTDEFYMVVNTQSCLDIGQSIDQDTVHWWNRQSPEARLVLEQAKAPTESGVNYPVREVMSRFASFAHYNSNVWGNGSDFDNAIIQEIYRKLGIRQPWAFWNNRCYRTMKNMFPDIKHERQGTYHNALDDAKTQALHLCKILKHMRGLQATPVA